MIRMCKKIVSFFATIWFVVQKIPLAYRGYRFLRHAPKDNYYIICPFSLGDVVVAAIAAKHLQTGKHMVLLLKDGYRSFGDRFDGVRCVADTSLAGALKWYVYLTRKYKGKNYLLGHFRHNWSGLIERREASLTAWEDYSKNVYGIPLECLHNSYHAAQENEEKKLTKRDVVLCPYAYTVQKIPMDFWHALARHLAASGYTVYTNIAGRETAIPGTEALRCGLNEVCGIVQSSAGCISLRSGLCDLLAVHSTTKLLIVNTAEKEWKDNWDVTLLRDKGVTNFLYEDAHAQRLIDTLVQYIQNTEVEPDAS